MDEIENKYNNHVTLLDFANYIIEFKIKVKVPQYLIEESKLIPRIKPRFYSITNDPFPNNEDKTKILSIVFSSTHFSKNDNIYRGHCTDFLTNFALE